MTISRWVRPVPVAFALLLLAIPCGTQAADYTDDAGINQQRKALAIIADFADRMCQTVPPSGGTNQAELSGSGKADLAKLVSQIADLGFKGASEYKESKYQGALQSDVTGLVKEGNECKLKVLDDLKDKLLTEGASSSLPSKSVTRQPSFYPTPLTLKQVFDTDFDVMVIDTGFTLTAK